MANMLKMFTYQQVHYAQLPDVNLPRTKVRGRSTINFSFLNY